jgi:hypothetical protein
MRTVPLRLALVGAAATLAIAPAGAQARTHHVRARAHRAADSWQPSARGGLDCNGWSPVQRTFRQMWCTEIAANSNRGFLDNGWYVGHDEPDIGWFSFKHGSSNDMSYTTTLPHDPSAPPSATPGGVTHEFELTPARWFGMVMCDNESYPEGTKVCKPDSDSNVQVPPRPDHAGAAYMELQMYPPGFAPAISCDDTHWCAALTIDSLQAQYGALHGPGSPPNAIANNNCAEPVNFAFLTHSGTPVGPPGPDQQNDATFTTTPDVLLMNPGDTIHVSMHDTKAGFFTEMTDLTTHQTGTMTASVANGFRHILWDPVNLTCNGAPYAFHPMYDRALPPLPNGQPTAWTTWSAHTDNVAYDVETGHFQFPDSSSDLDPNEDAPCIGGSGISAGITGCLGSDSDFDGVPYHADWPNGSSQFPTPTYVSSPRSGPGKSGGETYPIARFETDLPRIEEANNGGGLACDHHTGAGCTNPPPGAFYPWYHLLRPPTGERCAWALTNDGVPGQISNFGGEQAAWGPLETTDYGFDVRIHNYARSIINPCP